MKKITLPIIAIAASIILSGCSFGTGQHTGYVTAIDKNGIIWRNYHVYFKTDLASSQEDVYCVPLDETNIVEQLRQKQKEKTLVTISYGREVYLASLSRCEGDVITKVE